MSVHYDILQRVKTRIYWLGLQDRDGNYIPAERIVVLKTEAINDQRINLEQSGVAFPGIFVFHEENAERYDKAGSTNRQNLMFYPVFITIADTDRGPGGSGGAPADNYDHDFRLQWRHLINQHFCSDPTDAGNDPPVCITNKIQSKMFDFRDWNDNGLWRSTLAFEFGVYIWRDSNVATVAAAAGTRGLFAGDAVGLKLDGLME